MDLLTNLKSLFDIICKETGKSEKKVMLDTHATRQGYLNWEKRKIILYAQAKIKTTD